MIRAITVLLFIFSVSLAVAQTDSTTFKDTVNPAQPLKDKEKIPTIKNEDTIHIHSPRKAMIYSAIIPGGGQIYNKKYWKAPIVWAGFGVLAYFINQNNHEYKRFKKAYNYAADTLTSTVSEFPNVDPSVLANERDIYRKWRDLSIILTFGWYALNIIDANVDAHLFTFDVSDVATLHWEPSFNMAYNQPGNPFTGGVRLTLGF